MTAKRFAALTVAAVFLTGCSSPANPTASEPEPETDCITVSDGVAAALSDGIDMADVTLTQYAAVPDEDVWYVAAAYDSPDIDGTATWVTTQDPTGDSAAFLSVDATAETISVFNRIEGGTAGAPGAIAATACLN